MSEHVTRSTDPATSREAARTLDRAYARGQVYAMAQQLPYFTAREMERHLPHLTPQRVRTEVLWLVDHGLLTYTGGKRTNPGGHAARIITRLEEEQAA